MSRRGFVAGVFVISLACGPASPTRPQISVGMWGGDHVELRVSETGATVEFDCAHGTLDAPLAIDSNGHFEVGGTFVREHGGPGRVDEEAEKESARYAGTSNGRTMTLTVMLTSAPQPLGPFALVFGQPGRLLKCL
jgi:hypothetical protein